MRKLPLVLVGLFVCLAITTHKSSLADSVETCLAGFCLGPRDPDISRTTLISKYGSGCAAIGARHPDDKTLRYFLRGEQLWLWLSFDHEGKQLREVFVTAEPLCKDFSEPKRKLATVRTGKNIGVGMTVEKLTSIYGPPTRIDDSVARERRDPRYGWDASSLLAAKYGSKVFVYLKSEESLATAMFYADNGKIRSILISISE